MSIEDCDDCAGINIELQAAKELLTTRGITELVAMYTELRLAAEEAVSLESTLTWKDRRAKLKRVLAKFAMPETL